MSLIIVRCPHCSFSRQVPSETLPDQPVQATCPKCKQIFEFTKPADTVPPLATAPGMMPPPLPAPPRSTPSSNTRTGASSQLLSVGELFSATWEIFKQRWLILTGLFVATAIAAVVPPMLVGVTMGGVAKASFSSTVIMIMLFGLALIASMVILFWGMAATVAAAVDKTLGFTDAFQRAKGCWISFIWVSSLYSFIVGGASLLFIIPGILTGIWFFASPYLVMNENTRGMDALLKSKALVDGRFWKVLGRLTLIWVMGMVLGMIPVIGALFSLVMAPFSMLYSVLLYRNLSETADTVTWSSTDGTKAGWLLLGLAGYLLVPLLLFFMMGAALFSNFDSLFQMMIDQQQRHQQTLSINTLCMSGTQLPVFESSIVYR